MRPTFDSAWRKRLLAGDRQAAAALAEAALEPLYAFCLYRVGRNRHLCEEVVQETLLQAIARVQDYDPHRAGDSIYGWLTGLARNQIKRVLARERAAASLDALWERMDQELLNVYERLESQDFGPDLLEREETRHMVNATMSQLPPHYRQALEAKYLGGASVHDMAADLGASEKAVESLLTRAREAFRATFLALSRNLGFEALG